MKRVLLDRGEAGGKVRRGGGVSGSYKTPRGAGKIRSGREIHVGGKTHPRPFPGLGKYKGMDACKSRIYNAK